MYKTVCYNKDLSIEKESKRERRRNVGREGGREERKKGGREKMKRNICNLKVQFLLRTLMQIYRLHINISIYFFPIFLIKVRYIRERKRC